MKIITFIFLALVVYMLNEYRLVRKYTKAIEKLDKNKQNSN